MLKSRETNRNKAKPGSSRSLHQPIIMKQYAKCLIRDMPKMPLELKREIPHPEYVKKGSGCQEGFPSDDSQAKSQ